MNTYKINIRQIAPTIHDEEQQSFSMARKLEIFK
jgi:hypothetical protein